MSDLSERLEKAAGGGKGPRMSDYVGQTITVVGIEKGPSPFEKGRTSVKATIIDAEGNEVWFYVTPTGADQLLVFNEDEFPIELGVESFPGRMGNPGYKFVEP